MCHFCDADDARRIAEAQKVVPINLDFSTSATLVRAAVAIRGEEYVYPSSSRGGCDYVHKDQDEKGAVTLAPGCIVGMVFYMAGLPLEVFKEIGGTIGGTRDQFKNVGLVMTEKAMDFLRAAQVKQDNGIPWGEARKDALLYVAGREYHFTTEEFIAIREGSEDVD